MDVGIYFFTTGSSMDVVDLARRAEELGFESCWVPEHIAIPVQYSTPYFADPEGGIPEPYRHIVDPFIALARASAVTTRIKLGTSICLVPEHHPVHLAKQVATLDYYSKGRFLFGIGAGWLREETEVMGGNFDHRWSHAKDSILAMKELWTKDEPEYHGRFVDFPPLVSSPKPVQKPYPPILLGSKAPNVFKRVVEWGNGWMPGRVDPEQIRRGRAILDELASAAGRDPRSISISVFGWPNQFPDKKTFKEYEEAGADRVLLWLGQCEDPSALTEMEDMARLALD